jgi:hypothetical protein
MVDMMVRGSIVPAQVTARLVLSVRAGFALIVATTALSTVERHAGDVVVAKA